MKNTINNLAAAFIGESQARNRYTYYAKAARNEGYEQIAGIFEETANQEKEHAKWLIRLIGELQKKNKTSRQPVKVPMAEVITVLGTTEENLSSAIAGENYEYTSMYPGFAKIAQKEKLSSIADRLRSIAKAESHHEERYKKLLKELKNKTLFKKKTQTQWICRECGYPHSGKTPPKICPSCGHAQAFYQVKCEKY
ncbi:MAG: rubrerythrin [Patescibacteria group bacterium]|nr:rubrerythrin family protein [Patescibacteria group bacterium]